MNEATIIEVNNKNLINKCNNCGIYFHIGVILLTTESSIFVCCDCFDNSKDGGT